MKIQNRMLLYDNTQEENMEEGKKKKNSFISPSNATADHNKDMRVEFLFTLYNHKQLLTTS